MWLRLMDLSSSSSFKLHFTCAFLIEQRNYYLSLLLSLSLRYHCLLLLTLSISICLCQHIHSFSQFINITD